jgi:hypothetical protein
MRPKAAARRRFKDAQRRSARDDHMRLHFSVDRSLTETLRDLASGGFRRFGKPARISGFDLIAERRSLAETDGCVST